MFDRLHHRAPMAARAVAGATPMSLAIALGALILLGGCHHDDTPASTPPVVMATYTLGGSVSGVPAGAAGLVLENGGTTIAVAGGSTTFEFPGSSSSGTSYITAIQSLPAGLTCTVADGSGTFSTANIGNVVVTCSDKAFSVGGTVTGLNASGLVLANGTDTITLAAGATSFAMPTLVANTGSYAVTVETQPAGVNCSVADGSGTVAAGSVSSIAVTCSDEPFTVGGSIAGLNGGGLVLANGSDILMVPAHATSFTLPTGVAFSASYAVTIQTQPPGITCTLSNAAGIMPAANITNVALTCSDQAFTLGGTLTGLTTTGLVLSNGTDMLAVPANATTFTLHTAVAFTSAYAVIVHAQPAGLFCTANGATGTMPASNVTSVVLTCSTSYYTLGGTISGLTANGLVLHNGTDSLAVMANATTFTLPTAVASGAPYAVAVTTQPKGYTCVVSNGSGTMGGQPVTSVSIACTANPQFALSPNYNSNVLFQYVVNPSTQTLSASPTASYTTGNTPVDVIASPSGGFVYTVNKNDGTISGFSVNPTSSVLTALGTVTTVSNPEFMTINSAGTFAFAGGMSSGSVAVYAIASDGTLTMVNNSPFNSGASTLYGLALNPAGTVLYVAGHGSNTVQAMSINASGTLTLLGGPISTPSPYAIVVNPAGTYAYVTNQGTNTVSEFSIATNGTLTSIGTIPTDGSAPLGITIDPTGQFVYTANNRATVGTSTAVSAFHVGSAGTLTSLGAVATGLYPATVTVNAAGNTLYAVDNENNSDGPPVVFAFSINPSTGALTRISTSAGQGGSAQNSLVIVAP